MNTLQKYLERMVPYGRVIWVIGFGAVIVGELLTALDGKPGGTISEWFKGLPNWVKLAIFLLFGAIFSHLAEWRINDLVAQATTEEVNTQSCLTKSSEPTVQSQPTAKTLPKP